MKNDTKIYKPHMLPDALSGLNATQLREMANVLHGQARYYEHLATRKDKILQQYKDEQLIYDNAVKDCIKALKKGLNPSMASKKVATAYCINSQELYNRLYMMKKTQVEKEQQRHARNMEIIKHIAKGIPITDIAHMYNMHRSTIHRIKKQRTWWENDI